MQNECVILGLEYVEECARVMADAFQDSPVYRYIFRGKPEFRKSALEWMFIRNIRIVLKKCPNALRGILNEKKDNEVICCFMWVPEEHQDASLGEMLWHGIWQMPLWFGFDVVNRMLQVMDDMKAVGKDCIDKQKTKITNKKPGGCSVINLQRMVVHPDFQGQGLGTKALKTVITEEFSKDNNANSIIKLETQEPRNVSFYERLDFKIIHDRDCHEENDADEEYKYHEWYMVLMDNS